MLQCHVQHSVCMKCCLYVSIICEDISLCVCVCVRANFSPSRLDFLDLTDANQTITTTWPKSFSIQHSSCPVLIIPTITCTLINQ